jgi:Peptidase family M28
VTQTADIDALVGFERRVAGSDAERRAANHLAGRLRDLGRDAAVEPISIFPAWHLTHALHAALAVVGSVLSVESPVLGTAVAAVTLVSIAGDATGVFHLLRRLTGRRASQNVISVEDGEKEGTLVLVAHYDASRSGFVFRQRLPGPPLGPLFWSTAAVLACAALRIPGLEGQLLTALQFVPTVVLIVHLPLLVDVALSDPAPGANDNASGVATALHLAESHGGRLEHFDLWVLLTGAQEGFALGAREFLRARRDQLSRTGTVFVNLDELGAGDVRFSRREGLLFATRSHAQLRRLCHELAEDDPDAGARPILLRAASDAGAAQLGGFPAITICGRPAPHHRRQTDTGDNLDEGSLERAFGFCSELVERLDQEVGPELRR